MPNPPRSPNDPKQTRRTKHFEKKGKAAIDVVFKERPPALIDIAQDEKRFPHVGTLSSDGVDGEGFH